MNFIEAVIAISKRKDLDLCDDPTELSGEEFDICVYKEGSFIGKLRWPSDVAKASVDEEIIKELNG